MSKTRIAVVAENRGDLDQLRRVLEGKGDVDMFHNEDEFLRRGKPEDFDCIFVDLQTGRSLHPQLSEARCTTPLVYLAHSPTVPDAVDSIKRGAVDYLPISVDAETLERSLQAALRQKRTGVPDRHFCTALGLEAKLDNMERELIGEALQRAGGVVGGRNGAARLLGVTRTGLLYKMRRLNVSRAAVDGLDGEESSDGERASGASAGAV